MGIRLKYNTIISFDERISRKHERIMTMTPEIEDYVVCAVNGDPIEE